MSSGCGRSRFDFAFAIGIADATGQRGDAIVREDVAIERIKRRNEREPARPSARRAAQTWAIAGVLVAALSAPFLSSPLLLDDVVHRAMLAGRIPAVQWGVFELYDFLGGPGRDIPRLRDAGAVPWFAGDDLSLRFLRPLSSGTLALDAWAFGSRIWPAHLHSLLWLLGVLAVASALHARLLPPRIARLATIVYAVAGAHAMPVLWTAARHTLVTAALALAAFYLHVRGRIDPWAPGRVLAPLVFAAALLGANPRSACWRCSRPGKQSIDGHPCWSWRVGCPPFS